MSDATQEIVVNGETMQVPTPLTVHGLLEHLKIDTRHVAVESNRKLVVKTSYEEASVESGDHLEIVSFVGGG